MNDYLDILEDNMPDLIRAIKELVSIPSVVSDAVDDMPFGKDVYDALKYMLEMAEKDGFEVFNDQNYGGHIDFRGKGSGVIALVNHLDVVPAGDISNWESDPFSAEVRDGKLFGRGVLDNKGPLLICYFAMKALKEAGYIPDKTIRLILGCDEETNWFGMDHYMENVRADIVGGFSADADFPVIHAEKGIVQYWINVPVMPETYDRIAELRGGTVMNAVPDRAVLKIKAGRDSRRDALVTISASGKTAHAAWPEKGENAISDLFSKLVKTDVDCEDLIGFAEFYNEHIGNDVHGTGMGCGFSDEPSGKLSFNVSKIEKSDDGSAIRLGVDIRFPVTMTEEEVRRGIEEVIAPYGYGLELIKNQDPLYIPKDDPIVETLMNIYRECTGDEDAEPIVIGGGTYARAVPNTVAFGPVMPGDGDLCHLPNEYMELTQIGEAAKIYARAIYELSGAVSC